MKLPQFSPLLRLATSGAMIFGVLAAVAGVSSAIFTTPPATAAANSLSTGNASLLIAPDPISGEPAVGDYTTSIPGAALTGLLPGGAAKTFKFWLKNESDTPIRLDSFADLRNIVKPGDLGSNLSIAFACNVQGLSGVDGAIAAKTLDDWDDDVAPVGGLGTLHTKGTASAKADCTMTASLAAASTSQGTTATFDVDFTGTQLP